MMEWNDDYVSCPACGSMQLNRDLRDRFNSCHDCGFTHWVGKETTEQALERHKNKQVEDDDGGLCC